MKSNSKFKVGIVLFIVLVGMAVISDYSGNKILYYVSLALIAVVAYNLTSELKNKK